MSTAVIMLQGEVTLYNFKGMMMYQVRAGREIFMWEKKSL